VETHSPCTECGAPLAHGQEYCLECGARFVAPKRRLHWLWPSLAALAVAAGAATVAAAVDTGGPRTIVALGRLRPAPAAMPVGGGFTAWLRADAFTIAVGTLPADRGLAAARQRARRALRGGLEDVGVLSSSGYASLHPGYFIVFSGVYDTADEAQAALPRAKRSFPNARVLRIIR
jgi:hypothetical protein